MAHIDRWRSRPNINIPQELTPVIKNRIAKSTPNQAADIPPDERLADTLQEALLYLSKTGSGKDGQKALDILTLFRVDGTIETRDGSILPPVVIGESTHRIDYTSRPAEVGSILWAGVDFGDKLSMADHLLKALPEPDKRVRNQCVAMHSTAAYEWLPQGCPRRPPSLALVQSAEQQTIQFEYQEDLRRSKEAQIPQPHRDYELLSVVHDVLNTYRDRVFVDLEAFLGGVFSETNIPLAAFIEIDTSDAPSSHRASIFPTPNKDIPMGRTLTLGVWGNRARFLPPSTETTAAD